MINQTRLTSGKRPVRIIQNLPIRKCGPKNGKGIFTMDERLQKILRIPAQELGKGSPVQLRVVDTDKDMCYDSAGTPSLSGLWARSDNIRSSPS